MNTLPIIASAIIAFLATLSAGVFIRKLKSNIGVVCAFSSGFFIALSVFDILPTVLDLAPEAQISLGTLLLTSFAGFIFLFVLTRGFSSVQMKNHHDVERTVESRAGILSTLEFCSHAFIEGIAIGVSFQLQFGLGIFVAFAVVSHDFCDGISTLALMLNSGNSLKSSMSMLLVDALSPLLGAGLTLFFAVQNYYLIYTLAFLFGSFLYIGAGTLLPDAYRMNRPVTTVIFFLIGFLLIVSFSRAAAL